MVEKGKEGENEEISAAFITAYLFSYQLLFTAY
jgi:hypothetical protein